MTESSTLAPISSLVRHRATFSAIATDLLLYRLLLTVLFILCYSLASNYEYIVVFQIYSQSFFVVIYYGSTTIYAHASI